MKPLFALFAAAVMLTPPLVCGNAHAQCTELGPFHNYTGSGQTTCPCFAVGEEAGVVLDVPPGDYPIKITKIGIGWASAGGGQPQQFEEAIHIYGAGLPNPGTPIYSLLGPLLNDGFINEFDIELDPANPVIASGPFTVTLEFFNASSFSSPSVVHDANGCQGGKNVIYAIPPGAWFDACALGVTGDWVFQIKYKSVSPAVAAASPSPVVFASVPAYQTTCDTVYVRNEGCENLLIDGIGGCDTSPFSIDTSMTSHTVLPGDSTPVVVCVMPTMAGADACTLSVVSNSDDGTLEIPVSLEIVTAVGDPAYPGGFNVSVFPNPFNPSTTVRFSLPWAMPVTAEVYSVDGAKVRTLAKGETFSAGDNTLFWNGLTERNEPASSGVYLIRLTSEAGQRVARAVLLK
jgi:hypothetical protein